MQQATTSPPAAAFDGVSDGAGRLHVMIDAVDLLGVLFNLRADLESILLQLDRLARHAGEPVELVGLDLRVEHGRMSFNTVDVPE